MNRIDRLFAMTVLLQSRRRVRAQDLADEFDVSLRTIYRDIQALSESGIPVVSLPGQGYELVEGFSLPPVAFTAGEASALILGARLLAAQARGNRTASDALHSAAKIAAILPKTTLRQVERTTEVIEIATPHAAFDLDDPHLTLLQQAIHDRRVVRLRYHSLSRDETTMRMVEPRSLSYTEGAWYLNGYCRMRRANRAFRLNRIEQVIQLDETFQLRSFDQPSVQRIEVRVRFNQAISRWVRERQHWSVVGDETEPVTGDLIVTYRVDRLAEISGWLLGWGRDAITLSPPELRDRLRQEVLALAAELAPAHDDACDQNAPLLSSCH